MNQPAIQLNEITAIPQIGLGTWKLTGEDGREAVKQALDTGYRHIDTAYHYHNHRAVGKAVRESAVDREDVFITTKIWRDHLTEDKLRQQFGESLQQLGMDYVDLLLVHWPNESVPVRETLQTMAELQDAGKVQAVGVSNFTIELLREALETGVTISVNQVEYHPSLVQADLKNFCNQHDVTITAYSPLGHNGRDLQLDPVQQIADSNGVSPATVIIAWLIQQGIVAIPKAEGRQHQQQNLQAANLTLSDKEIDRINRCNTDNRIISPDYGPFAADGKR